MYVSLQREFTETWRVMQQAKEEAEIARLREKATKIKLEQIRHDFALLKLEQSVKRPKYLQLEPYIPPNATLLLSGYCNSPPLNFYQWIYSSKPAEICDPAIYYDMDTKAGQGGSPVYLEGQDCRVVGMHKGLHFGKKLRFATLITPPIIATIK
jgi:V8-like Glu-specific endopeptidase